MPDRRISDTGTFRERDDMTTSMPWHMRTAEAACTILLVDPAHGLPDDASSQRLTHYGENRLAEVRPRPAWLKFLDRFKNLLVIRNETREPYARVLVAPDISPHGRTVQKLGRGIAPAAHLTLGHAHEAAFEHKPRFAGLSEDDILRHRQLARARARTGLDALTDGLESGPASVRAPTIRIEHGKPESVFPILPSEAAADLIITGKHDHSEIVDPFRGSLIKSPPREAGCDVLVAPPSRKNRS